MKRAGPRPAGHGSDWLSLHARADEKRASLPTGYDRSLAFAKAHADRDTERHTRCPDNSRGYRQSGCRSRHTYFPKMSKVVVPR